jgi:type I restriction enzyme R subunit
MNEQGVRTEADTRAELIDPFLSDLGWGNLPQTKVFREFKIAAGRIRSGGRQKALYADYILSYENVKLAVIEAKSEMRDVGEGVAQAKNYAQKLNLDFAFSTNGKKIYRINMKTSEEGLVDCFPTPEELWEAVHEEENDWMNRFNAVLFEDMSGSKPSRFYQEIAVNKVLEAISKKKERILLTLATGTGKTYIAFQIAWKLFNTRWNLNWDGKRRPRILFLADRNILADQAFNAFNAFEEDALVRIAPASIRKQGRVPTNGSVFFTIFQTFMSGSDKEGNSAPYFGEYPEDYFDFIIIDECHRGGANNESNWRGILEYFSPAVQLGLTATPKRLHNADTYAYFGDPVYCYSLKEGIEDGFLTPFKVKRIQTNIDEYMYTPDDTIIEGEVDDGRVYGEEDFNKVIEIREREEKRVRLFMDEINQDEKTLVFCATQVHALAIRDLINQIKKSKNVNYCHRVTANDGALGEQYLKLFQDNEKTIPTILTTSQKLSTGVDARNVRNIILLRPVNSMIEFKQIVGRGTRLFDGKEHFTVYDFVGAYHHFADPEWDGEPLEPDPSLPVDNKSPVETTECEKENADSPEKIIRQTLKIKLSDGKIRELQHMVSTYFYGPEGKPVSIQQFLENLYGKLPDYFKDEDGLRKIWSVPETRKKLLEGLNNAGYGPDELKTLQLLVNAENSDLFDVLEYVAFSIKPIPREERVRLAKPLILNGLTYNQINFLEFVLSKYVECGVDELSQEKLPHLVALKYNSLPDAVNELGSVENIKETFIAFQKFLYEVEVA